METKGKNACTPLPFLIFLGCCQTPASPPTTGIDGDESMTCMDALPLREMYGSLYRLLTNTPKMLGLVFVIEGKQL